jgi:hypothetical protein
MSQDRLALSQVALLVAYAVGMAGGQMLFWQLPYDISPMVPPLSAPLVSSSTFISWGRLRFLSH